MNDKKLPEVTVNKLYQEGKLNFRRGIYNIIDCGVRTGKTYWATHNLKDFTRDGKLNRILFLVNTTILKDQIINDYSDYCMEANSVWEAGLTCWWGEQSNKIGVMCYQQLGSQLLKKIPTYLDELDVICWDECDSIFDFAVEAFHQARKTDFARKDMSNSEVLSIIQQYSTKKEYMPLVLLGEWEKIVKYNKIYCIGLSATPERAQHYYNTIVGASNLGKIDAGYRIGEEIYFTNIMELIKDLHPEPGRGYWCYSPSIRVNEGIVIGTRDRGFNSIELHSPTNSDKPMTSEQMRVYNMIRDLHMVPYEYDFVVINATMKNGITIEDSRFDRVIVNDLKADSRKQASRQTFPHQVYLKTWIPEVPATYMNVWLTVPECRELAELMGVKDPDIAGKHSSKILTWNSLKDELIKMNYKVENKRKRINGKQQTCYYISGEWKDVLPPDTKFDELVDAKANKIKNKNKSDNLKSAA